MNLSIDDLNEFGKARVEDDFQWVERRDGGKTSRIDFALGWMAAMVRDSWSPNRFPPDFRYDFRPFMPQHRHQLARLAFACRNGTNWSQDIDYGCRLDEPVGGSSPRTWRGPDDKVGYRESLGALHAF